jgi:hypothetical protein
MTDKNDDGLSELNKTITLYIYTLSFLCATLPKISYAVEESISKVSEKVKASYDITDKLLSKINSLDQSSNAVQEIRDELNKNKTHLGHLIEEMQLSDRIAQYSSNFIGLINILNKVLLAVREEVTELPNLKLKANNNMNKDLLTSLLSTITLTELKDPFLEGLIDHGYDIGSNNLSSNADKDKSSKDIELF